MGFGGLRCGAASTTQIREAVQMRARAALLLLILFASFGCSGGL